MVDGDDGALLGGQEPEQVNSAAHASALVLVQAGERPRHRVEDDEDSAELVRCGDDCSDVRWFTRAVALQVHRLGDDAHTLGVAIDSAQSHMAARGVFEVHGLELRADGIALAVTRSAASVMPIQTAGSTLDGPGPALRLAGLTWRPPRGVPGLRRA